MSVVHRGRSFASITKLGISSPLPYGNGEKGLQELFNQLSSHHNAQMTETSCTPSPVPAATSPVAVASGALDGKSTAPIDDPTLKDSEEPQNPLTKKFTDAEWAALKEFRVCASEAS